MQLVPVARIVGMHGLKGYLKLEVLTDFPAQQLSSGSRLRLDDDWVTVRSTSLHQGRLMVQLEGFASRTLAEPLRGKTLDAPPIVPEMDEGEYLVKDLIGADVVTVAGESLGKVDDVLPMPAHDVLVVREVMVPFVKAFVKKVDLTSKRITVELIPGMTPGVEEPA